jgi:hypothetical protein
MQRPHRQLAAIAALASLLLAACPAIALADEPANAFADVSLVSPAFNLLDGAPTVVVRLDCRVDVAFLRVRVTLSQRSQLPASALTGGNDVGRIGATSVQSVDAACHAGVSDFAVRFGPQQGVFTPGPAQITGFVAAFGVPGFLTIGPAPLNLLPVR